MSDENTLDELRKRTSELLQQCAMEGIGITDAVFLQVAVEVLLEHFGLQSSYQDRLNTRLEEGLQKIRSEKARMTLMQGVQGVQDLRGRR